jgi:hypothetical protein
MKIFFETKTTDMYFENVYRKFRRIKTFYRKITDFYEKKIFRRSAVCWTMLSRALFFSSQQIKMVVRYGMCNIKMLPSPSWIRPSFWFSNIVLIFYSIQHSTTNWKMRSIKHDTCTRQHFLHKKVSRKFGDRVC